MNKKLCSNLPVGFATKEQRRFYAKQDEENISEGVPPSLELAYFVRLPERAADS